MKYKLQVRQYRRSFKKPLVTSKYILNERKGLIVRLESEDGGLGFGEIAPLEFLGSESFENAKKFCMQLSCEIDDHTIASIDPKMPCCRCAFQSAQIMLQGVAVVKRDFEVAALLSLYDNVDNLQVESYRTFKCKIGKDSFEKERHAFLLLHQRLPQNAILRLDANGAFTKKETQQWLEFLDDYQIQFLEQPLPKGQESLMVELSRDYKTPIGLDESIINIDDFERILENWCGWVVVKPSFIADFIRFRKLRSLFNFPIVYSSIFESSIGIEAALTLAATDNKNDYTIGFGTVEYFGEDDPFCIHKKGPHMRSGEVHITDFEKIWNLCQPIN